MMKLIALNPISHGYMDQGRLMVAKIKPGDEMNPDMFSEEEIEQLVASGSASIIGDPDGEEVVTVEEPIEEAEK